MTDATPHTVTTQGTADRPGGERYPRIAVFTVTMNRLDYTVRTFESLRSSTSTPFDHYIVDNGSTDGTLAYLAQHEDDFAEVATNGENVGLDVATNQALDLIGEGYDYIIKVDNDCEFVDPGWLEVLLEVCEARGRRIALSPRATGLGPPHLDGGHPRYAFELCNGYTLGLSKHVGGLCLLAPAETYSGFRFKGNALHGNQDVLFSLHVRLDLGYEMGYVEDVRVRHMDTTQGQVSRYPEYFANRDEWNRRVHGESQLVTRLLWPVRRLRFLKRLERAGLLECGAWRYVQRRLAGALRTRFGLPPSPGEDDARAEERAAGRVYSSRVSGGGGGVSEEGSS